MKTDKKINIKKSDPKPNQEVIELKVKIAELENGWKRTQADFENFRNRTQTEKGELIKYANKELILEILPVIDNFSRALKHKPKELIDNEYLKGLEYTKIQLEQILSQYGLEKINVKAGDIFDHNIHEAIEAVDSKDLKSGHIAEIVLDGFKLNNQIIRPAKVKVIK